MAKWAIVDNGTVVNVVVADSAEAIANGWVAAGVNAEPGGTYDGSAFTLATHTVDSSEMRAIRNQLLDETDWWAVSDRTMTSAQTNYRQALRDLPANSDWPNIEWPTKP
tara:strand:+ start:590 stop:916 length:327 start_codon:yes stop_codon:yes gene_type:complete